MYRHHLKTNVNHVENTDKIGVNVYCRLYTWD